METENKKRRIRRKSLPELAVNMSEEMIDKVNSVIEENTINQITFGWNNAADVASEIWQQGNFKLLEGDLVLAYKNLGNTKTGLFQVVVVKYFQYEKLGEDKYMKVYDGDYGVSVMTSTYSYILPHVTKEYLNVLIEDLMAYKIDNNIFVKLKKILENEIISN